LDIRVNVMDGVYGRPAEGVEVSIVFGSPWEPDGKSSGRTDFKGNFSYSAAEDSIIRSQCCSIRLDVDAYFTSLGIIAGWTQMTLLTRIIDSGYTHQVVAVITPFILTNWTSGEVKASR
jgi:hypothetical protein